MKKIGYFLLLFALIFMSRCAKIVAPIGGPKDISPPKILKISPPDQSTNFNAKTIKITFDEFIVLNNPTERVIFSPPIAEMPDFSISRKSMVIKFQDSLQKNRTYNIAFPDCVKDYTEGNLLSFFSYTLSTGDFIDSFFVKGEITDALTLAPVADCFVFLYTKNIDSLPYTSLPDYISRTNKEGKFSFMNIIEGNYKIFALKDINQNFLYDLPNEAIAFQEETVEALPLSLVDSLEKDNDELSKKHYVRLRLFTEEDTLYRKAKMVSTKYGEYKFIFHRPVEALSIQLLDTNQSIAWFEKMNLQRDTLSLFMKQVLQDTVPLLFHVEGITTDTFYLAPHYEAPTRGRGAKKEPEEKMPVTMKNAEDLYQPLHLQFPSPILPADSLPVTLIKKKKSGNDTLTLFLHIPDQFTKTLVVDFQKEEKVPYTLMIRDSLFWNYQQRTQDSLIFHFSVKSEKDYGDLIIHYQLEDESSVYIATLLSSTEKNIQIDTISFSTTIKYSNLLPDQYRVRMIEDKNANGKWDTGNYKKKTQPEAIFYFEKPLLIRGYWEVEEWFQVPRPNHIR